MKKLDIKDVDFSGFMGVLRNINFFSSMSIGQIEKVLPFIKLYLYEKDEIICKQGDLGDSFFIIREGSVKVSFARRFFFFKKNIAVLGPREFFGEMSLISNEPRNATVKCLETTQVFVLMAKDFDFMLSKNPQFSDEIKRIVGDRKLISKSK